MTRGAKIAGAVGLGALILYITRPKGTVTTSETFRLGDSGIFDSKVKNFAQAIARAEGFYVPRSIPARANNPGNLKLGAPTLDGSGITLFESAAQGWNALYNQLGLIINSQSAHYDLGMTIEEMGAVYEADPGNNWARNVAAFLGVSTATPLYDVLT